MKVRDCISPLIAQEISDLSVLAQCATFVEKYYHQAVHSRNIPRSFCQWFYDRMKGWVTIYGGDGSPDWRRGPILELGDPTDGKHHWSFGDVRFADTL